MRKNVFGRHLKRDTNERKALFKGLASSLVINERIKTTEEKAKAVRPLVEKLVTRARIGDKQAHSLVQPYLNAVALKKMMSEIGPRFKERPGGYTRIIKMGPRLQDNASVVILEWVERPAIIAVTPSRKGSKETQGKKETKVSKQTETVEAEIVTETEGTKAKKVAAKAPKVAKEAKTTKKTVKKAPKKDK